MKKIFFTGIVCLLFFGLSGCAELTSIFDSSGQPSPTARTESVPKTKKTQTVSSTTKMKESSSVVDSKSEPQVIDPQTGMRLPITTKKGTYYFVAQGDTLENIAKRYKIAEEDLAQINDLFESNLLVGRRLFIPKKANLENYLTVTNLILMRQLEKEQTNAVVKFEWPVKEFVLTSKFGWRRKRQHDGLDLSAKRGTPFYAAADGVVLFSKKFAGYGYLLVLQHANGYFTAYAHAQTLSVNKGDKVKLGKQIGEIGNTGRSTGPHLHFEIHKGAQALDPVTVLPKRD